MLPPNWTSIIRPYFHVLHVHSSREMRMRSSTIIFITIQINEHSSHIRVVNIKMVYRYSISCTLLLKSFRMLDLEIQNIYFTDKTPFLNTPMYNQGSCTISSLLPRIFRICSKNLGRQQEGHSMKSKCSSLGKNH